MHLQNASRLTLLLLLFLGGIPSICAQSSESGAVSQDEPRIDIRQVMSAKEFKDAGLDKLTPEQLVVLNTWVNSFTRRVIKVTKKNSQSIAPQQAATPSVIESNIDGEFEGWSGETIFKLQNGQIWQQASYDYDYEYAYSPGVMIVKTSECYKMKVEDVEDSICVKRLR